MEELKKLLDGNKTYLTGIATIIASVAYYKGLIPQEMFWPLVTTLAGFAAIFMRMGVKKSGSDMTVPLPEVTPTQQLPSINEAILSALKDLMAQAQTKTNDKAKGAS